MIQESCSFTIPELVKRWRVNGGKIRGWISTGALRAINTRNAGAPRWIVPEDAVADFENRRAAMPAHPRQRRRATRRPRDFVEYF